MSTRHIAKRPDEDTEPRVQQLFIGPYRETGMGSQDLASAGLSVFMPSTLAEYSPLFLL